MIPLTDCITQRRSERSSELHGFRRRYPKTRNYWVVTAVKLMVQPTTVVAGP